MKPNRHPPSPACTVIGGMALYTVLLGWACQAKYARFAYADFDLAIDAQSIWNVLHGSWQSSLHGIPFLGNHMRLILLVVAPLYALLPAPSLLLHLQTAALALGAWPVYLLAADRLPSRWAAGMALAYLAYAPLIAMNLYEFHPVAFASTFLLAAMRMHARNRFAWFCAWLGLAMLCQENIGLIAAGIGVLGLLQGRRGRWVWAPLGGGLAVFALTVLVIMPRLNPGKVGFVTLYGHLGGSLPEILSALVTRPHAALRVMATPAKTAFVNALLAPAGYLSLLAPGGLLPAAPVLLQRLLSGRASEASIAYHYQAEFIPFIFVAAVHGAARLFGAAGAKSPAGEPLPASFRSGVTRRGRLLLGALLALFPPVGLWATRVPQQLVAAIGGGDRDPFITDVKRGIVRSVPPEARVVATFAFLPRLANRRELHSLHHVYTGRHTLSDVPYPAPDADVLIMDTHDPLTFSAGGFYAPDNYRNLRALLARPGWKPVRHVEGLLVFRRGGAGGAEVRLVEIAGGQCGGDVAQDAAEPLRLTGFELGPPDKEGVADLTLCWRWSPGARPRDCGAELQINAGNHALYRGVVYPGSRIRPPQSWPEGVSVRDAHRVRVSPAPAEGARASIRVRLVPADSPAARGGRHSGPRGGP